MHRQQFLFNRAVHAALIWMVSSLAMSAAELHVEIHPRWAGAPLVFDALTNITAASQRVSVTRLDFLLSNIALCKTNGAWLTLTNSFAFIKAREGRTRFALNDVPAAAYDRIRFQVGVPTKENHANPGDFVADHPLNPNLNGLHWNWQGGYVFLAIEGAWSPEGSTPSSGGYSWHIATDRLLTTVELPVACDLVKDRDLSLGLNVDQIFSTPNTIAITDDTTSTHSRVGDKLAEQLRQNIERAFAVEAKSGERDVSSPLSYSKAEKAGLNRNTADQRKALVAPNATPYRFSFPGYFPKPALPMDNPLTEEGVELGRRLFHDHSLSINKSQSCASCHHAETAFSEARRFSLGAEGQIGARNAMPLLNLAWKSSFFWDGRAATLREQVLQPIQNPIEMHETLTNVVAKLSSRGSQSEEAHPSAATNEYPVLFKRAFGTPEISSDRIARALEQFLLAQVSHDSKFDRSLTGQAELTAEEQRGFELFNTEYDPRREQFGADCFHCHGGPLFQSQSFANNGLDATFKDLGRYEVTKRDGDKGKFAVPSLRNVAVTGPYMHDGRFETLEEVIEHYSSGVQRSATLDPNLAKHPDGGLRLSSADKHALVAFLKTLTDERFAPEHGKLARTR